MSAIFIPPAPPDPRRLGFNPRRNIGAVNARKRVLNLRLVQGLDAHAVPVAATAYPYLAAPFYLTDVDAFQVFLTAQQAVSGTPSGVQIVVQLTDGYGNFVPAPGSPYALALLPGVTTGVIAQPLAVQSFGELVALGLQASAPWAGGQLAITVKGKG